MHVCTFPVPFIHLLLIYVLHTSCMSLIYVLDHALCLPNAVCLQALLCVEGRKALYSYCREHEIPFKQLGKLIVATDARQIPSLEDELMALPIYAL